MGDPTTPSALPPKASGSWTAFEVALSKLVADLVRQEIESAPAAKQSAGGNVAPQELRKTVTEAVGAVLLETNVLERLFERQMKAHLASNASGKGAGGDLESIRQEVPKAVREYLTHHLGALFQTEIRGVIQKEMINFLGSEELKELLDEKFRTINSFLKTEVIPKVVQQELSRMDS